MDIEKIHSVSGSLVTRVLRHQVALAQVKTQEANGFSEEGDGGIFQRGIQSWSPVKAGSTVEQPEGGVGLAVSQHVTELISNNNDVTYRATPPPG